MQNWHNNNNNYTYVYAFWINVFVIIYKITKCVYYMHYSFILLYWVKRSNLYSIFFWGSNVKFISISFFFSNVIYFPRLSYISKIYSIFIFTSVIFKGISIYYSELAEFSCKIHAFNVFFPKYLLNNKTDTYVVSLFIIHFIVYTYEEEFCMKYP